MLNDRVSKGFSVGSEGLRLGGGVDECRCIGIVNVSQYLWVGSEKWVIWWLEGLWMEW